MGSMTLVTCRETYVVTGMMAILRSMSLVLRAMTTRHDCWFTRGAWLMTGLQAKPYDFTHAITVLRRK